MELVALKEKLVQTNKAHKLNYIFIVFINDHLPLHIKSLNTEQK